MYVYVAIFVMFDPPTACHHSVHSASAHWYPLKIRTFYAHTRRQIFGDPLGGHRGA